MLRGSTDSAQPTSSARGATLPEKLASQGMTLPSNRRFGSGYAWVRTDTASSQSSASFMSVTWPSR
eukprot:609320-Rhodomonas_salina.4